MMELPNLARPGMRGMPSTLAACLVADPTAAVSRLVHQIVTQASIRWLHRYFSVTSRCPFSRTPAVHASQKAALRWRFLSEVRTLGYDGVDPLSGRYGKGRQTILKFEISQIKLCFTGWHSSEIYRNVGYQNPESAHVLRVYHSGCCRTPKQLTLTHFQIKAHNNYRHAICFFFYNFYFVFKPPIPISWSSPSLSSPLTLLFACSVPSVCRNDCIVYVFVFKRDSQVRWADRRTDFLIANAARFTALHGQ